MNGKTEKRFVCSVSKIVLALAIVLSCSMFLTGCAKNSDKVNYHLRGGFVEMQEYPSYYRPEMLISSLEELYVYCSMVGWRPSEPGKPWKCDSKIERVLKNYDEEYFTKKSLIIVVYKWDTSNDSIKQLEVTSIKKERNSLFINLNVIFIDADYMVPVGKLKHFVCILEVEKEDLHGANILAVRYTKRLVEYTPVVEEIFIY